MLNSVESLRDDGDVVTESEHRSLHAQK
jgi:hypothetical protein